MGKEQECREVLKLHTSPCVLSLQFSPRPLIRFRWGCVTRRDFSWGHPDTQWQLPEAAAAWKNSKTRKFYAIGRERPSLNQFLPLNLQWNCVEGWFGFRPNGFSGISGVWSGGWHPWELQAHKGNGEVKGEKSVCLPDAWEVRLVHRGGN